MSCLSRVGPSLCACLAGGLCTCAQPADHNCSLPQPCSVPRPATPCWPLRLCMHQRVVHTCWRAEIPHTATGKISKLTLRKQLAELKSLRSRL